MAYLDDNLPPGVSSNDPYFNQPDPEECPHCFGKGKISGCCNAGLTKDDECIVCDFKFEDLDDCYDCSVCDGTGEYYPEYEPDEDEYK